MKSKSTILSSVLSVVAIFAEGDGKHICTKYPWQIFFNDSEAGRFCHR